jgi:hypothetical protein
MLSGAGGGSAAAWVCERVGPTGRVLAMDHVIGFGNLLLNEHLRVCESGVGVSEKLLEVAMRR